MTTVTSKNTVRPDAPTAAQDLLARLATVPADRTAVLAGDQRLTFGELRAQAGHVASRLTAMGVGPESVVALCLPRGAALVTALLGALTAGAAYLPVDPRLPAERRRYLAEDAAADLVVVEDGADGSPAEGIPWLPFAELAAATGEDTPGADFHPVPVTPGGLAYVIYTSGSTGRPKGVEVSRGSVSALLAELEDAGIARTDGGRVGWNASPSFDASVQQWVRICRGDTLVMIDEETRTDPELLARLVDDAALTDLDITPSHADPLLGHLALDPAREPLTLLVGGEAITPALWRRLAERVDAGVLRAVNLYGPTECTVDSTAGWVASGESPHIGTALPGLGVRLLDAALRPVEDGEAGELYLYGPRVARGYRRRPGMTAERFVADLDSGGGARMYRTGDRCRRLSDGRLEYLGRTDGQIKLRGYRVELGEIESALAADPAVAEAAVVLREDSRGVGSLVGYYRARQPVETAALLARLTAELPSYMVPTALVEVERFPTTPNGKLDRAALPEPPAAEPAVAAGNAPSGPAEELIAQVWSTVLGVPGISADDNFFKLGGHSLLAIKLASRVRAELGIGLPVKTVYAHPKLRDLARQIESMVGAQAADRGRDPVPV